jgi:hypothetical protein
MKVNPPLITRQINQAEYERLQIKSNFESKTSPFYPTSPTYATNGEVMVKRWPENKINVVKMPLDMPLPITLATVYDDPEFFKEPNSRPTSSANTRGNPNNTNNPTGYVPIYSPNYPINKSSKHYKNDTEYSAFIDSLHLTVNEDEMIAIKVLQKALLDATHGMNHDGDKQPNLVGIEKEERQFYYGGTISGGSAQIGQPAQILTKDERVSEC